MKSLTLALALAGLVGLAGPAPVALAQSSPPPLPALDAAQKSEMQKQLDLYRTEIDGRVARGEISAEEASRLLAWREWQLAQQVAGLAPPPGPILEEAPVVVSAPYYRPAPVYVVPGYYGPYYGPAYYGPRYWGPSVCAGGFGRHFGGRFCF